jgi:hypothetical protein
VASKDNTIKSQFVTKAEAAQILGVEEKSVMHVEGEVDGRNLCLKAVPNLYSRADALAIRGARDQRAKEKTEKAEAARQPVGRQEPGDANKVQQAVQAAVDAS